MTEFRQMRMKVVTGVLKVLIAILEQGADHSLNVECVRVATVSTITYHKTKKTTKTV